MEFRQLITFKNIAENNSFKETAQKLGYTQSSVTTHIKSLEVELGHILFNRIGKSISLTKYGERLLPYVNQILDLHSKIEDLDENPKGNLTIGISESLMICRIPKILKFYKEKYPLVNISLKSINPGELTQKLKNMEIDLALILEKEQWQNSMLNIHKVNTEQMMLVRSNKNHNLDIALYSEKNCSYQSLMKDYFKVHNWEIKDSFEFQSIEAIKQCVESGLGVSMFPYFSVKKELDQNLFKGEALNLTNSISTFIVYHKDKYLSSSELAMIEIMKDCSKNWV